MKIRTLKISLTILTVLELSYLTITFYDSRLWNTLDFEFKVNYFIGFIHIIIVGLFIKKIWEENQIEKKKKVDSTLMIIVLGLIGMWLWLPKNGVQTK